MPKNNPFQNHILLFLKIPPPVTGATIMNKRVHESKLLNSNFNMRSICISYKENLQMTGKYTIKKLAIFLSVIFKLIKELVFHRPSFIYFQISPLGMAFIRDLCYVFVMKIMRIKVVYHIRGQGIEEQSKVKWGKKIYSYAFKNSELICLSNLLTYDLENVFNGIIHIVNNGIPDNAIQYLNEFENNRNKKVITILYLSNISESKGIIEFIVGLKLLKSKKLIFRARIVGSDGTFSANDLMELINKNELKNEIFYEGPKYGKEKYKILTQSDIMVHPTRDDAFPSVLLEAMQFNLPVIASREGAIPEIIDDGITGFLVEKDNPYQIADKLEILINNKELRNQMGASGRKKFLQNYTLEIFEQNMKSVFDDILSHQ